MDQIILLCITGIAAYIDLTSDRIPNYLCLTGALIGCGFSIYRIGPEGLGFLLGREAIWFVLLFPFWCLGIIGGGDVKLFLMCSVFLADKTKILFISTGIFLAAYAFFLMIYRQNMRDRLSLLIEYIRHCIVDGIVYRYPFDRQKEKEVKSGGMHVSLGILAGCLYGVLTELV